MADATGKQDSHHVHLLLVSLKKTSKDLQSNPISIIYNNYDINAAIEALLELGTKADPIISGDPSLFTLNQLLSNLKNLLEKLQKLQGYGLRSLLHRQLTNYKISQIGYAVEAEVQAHIARLPFLFFWPWSRSTHVSSPLFLFCGPAPPATSLTRSQPSSLRTTSLNSYFFVVRGGHGHHHAVLNVIQPLDQRPLGLGLHHHVLNRTAVLL